MLNVVIFGSAAAPAGRTVHDVDVAYAGDRAEAVALAVQWATTHGFADLPLDLHESQVMNGGLVIPSPCGLAVPAIALTPDTAVRVWAYHTLASYVRAYGEDLGRLAEELPDLVKLSVVAAPGWEDVPDWKAYVGGLRALRAAVAKTSNPEATAATLARAYGPVIGRLLREDPIASRDVIERLELNTSRPNLAGAVGVLTRTPSDQNLENLLYGG
ncbi:hypothetical protein [Nonomuraea sp. NPDC023979]|uniref:hypothetical protein n=1 Tax=Nonomuraea sp. NPDC023979 TaxID=3154796 RepID=UPI00340DC1B7